MPSKKNKSYWEGRQEQWLNNQDKMDASAVKKLEAEYKRTAKETEKEIAGYFQKYGKDNVIEFRAMMQDLSKADKDLLFQNMEAFADKYPDYADLMPVRESVYKLNRMQGLHYSTQMQLLELGAIEQNELEKHLEKTYGKRYKEMAKELGLGESFLTIDDELMKDTIFTKWVNNENFSDRIWENKDGLLSHLQTRYRDGIARGDSYAKLMKEVRERFNVGLSDAKRLVWTESSFILNQSHTHAYINSGVEEYDISAIRDNKTSPICRSLDGKRFRFDELEVGVNFPPFHSYCRTTFIGVLEQRTGTDTDQAVQEATEGIMSNEDMVTRIQEEEALQNELIDLEASLSDSKAERRRLLDELEDRFEDEEISISEYNSELERIKAMFKGGTQSPEVRERIKQLSSDLVKLKEQNAYANAGHVKGILGKYRSMGTGDIDLSGHLSKPRSRTAKAIMEAYDHYPTDWVKRSIEHGPLTTKTVKRGYYSHGASEIAISGGSGEKTSFRTALHEITHRQEYLNPGILEAEKAFYEARTKGEDLQKLRDVVGHSGYKASEVTRVDNFIDPYMGRDYDGRAYELLTMGVDTLYTRPQDLAKDPEMFDWVVKMLLTK